MCAALPKGAGRGRRGQQELAHTVIKEEVMKQLVIRFGALAIPVVAE
jgi:hypothetical protein